MFTKEENSFREICNNLENKYLVGDQINYIKLFLECYINGNRNSFIEIKALCEKEKNQVDVSRTINGIGAIASALSVMICMFSIYISSSRNQLVDFLGFKVSNYAIWVYTPALVTVIIFLLLAIKSMKLNHKNKNVVKWVECVELVLKEIENNWDAFFAERSKVLKKDFDICQEELKPICCIWCYKQRYNIVD